MSQQPRAAAAARVLQQEGRADDVPVVLFDWEKLQEGASRLRSGGLLPLGKTGDLWHGLHELLEAAEFSGPPWCEVVEQGWACIIR